MKIRHLFLVALAMSLTHRLIFAQDTTLTITNTGNVGIGTTTPAGKLDILTKFAGDYLRFATSTSGPISYQLNTSTRKWNFVNGFAFNDRLSIFDATASAERFVIAGPTGNVGIGTSTPAGKLDILTNFAGDYFRFETSTTGPISSQLNTSTRKWSFVNGFAFNDRLSIFDATASAERLVIAGPTGNVGIGTSTPAGKLDVHTNFAGDYCRFETSTSGPISSQLNTSTRKWSFVNGFAFTDRLSIFDATASVERFVIAGPTGNVGIGTSTPTATLEVRAGGSTLADAWSVRSSKRFKTNIATIEGALEKVKNLRGVTYRLKANGKRDIGLIAEEVGQVFPEVVTYERDGRNATSLDYSRLVAVLIEAIKEQQKQIDELKAAAKSIANLR